MKFLSFIIVYLAVSCLPSVSSESGMEPNLSQWQVLPWDAKPIYTAFLNLVTNCFQEQMQFASNKKLEHCTCLITMYTWFPIKGPSRLFGYTHTCTAVCHLSIQKKVRLCQDQDWWFCLLNLNVSLQKIFAPNTHSCMPSL